MHNPDAKTVMVPCAADAALYKDLLRKAHGNEIVAKSWMKEICGHDCGSISDTLIAASECPLLFSPANNSVSWVFCF